MQHPDSVLGRIHSPADLKGLSDADLAQLAGEMRSELIDVVGRRSAHFASNLGVVELCLALHLTFDFTQDRLIWDTGHQIYPHKLITGRAAQLHTIRTKGGLMGYPNPAESPFDLFMTGHAGCAPSTALGLKVGDDLAGASHRHSVAVIGDGALPSGIVFEAFNHASGLKQKLLVILNDNKMSICPRVGGLADYLDRARMSSTYNDWNKRVKWLLPNIPLVGEHAERLFQQFKDAIKASLHHGMLFEELGFVYLGPIDGHDLKTLRSYLERVKAMEGPVLLHVLTNKGHGFEPAVKDPVKFHAPAPFQQAGDGIVPLKTSSSRTYTDAVSDTLFAACQAQPRGRGDHRRDVRGEQAPEDPRVLPGPVLRRRHLREPRRRVRRGDGQDRRAAGRRHLQHLPPAVLRPDLPGSGPPGPAGRLLPRPRRAGRRRRADPPRRLRPGLSPRLPQHGGDGPGRREGHRPDVRLRPEARLRPWRCAIPEPTSTSSSGTCSRSSWVRPRSSSGRPTACSWPAARWSGPACGWPSGCADLYGLRVGVINARFVKPLDRETIAKAIEECGFVLTVEEGCLMGGFGSAVLEAANEAGLPTAHVRRLGLPDRYVLHAERDEQLAEVGLDVEGVTRAALALARAVGMSIPELAKAKVGHGAASSTGVGTGRPGRPSRRRAHL